MYSQEPLFFQRNLLHEYINPMIKTIINSIVFLFINIIGWHIHFVHISVALLLSEVHPYPQAIVYLAHQRCLVAGFWNVLFAPATRNELHIVEIQENLETLRMIVAKLHEKSLNNTLVQFTWKQ